MTPSCQEHSQPANPTCKYLPSSHFYIVLANSLQTKASHMAKPRVIVGKAETDLNAESHGLLRITIITGFMNTKVTHIVQVLENNENFSSSLIS